MKTTKSPDQAPATFSTPRRLTEPEIESLRNEMKQDMLKMQEHLETSTVSERLRQALKEE